MNKYEITNRIEKFAPLESAESWDSSGWIVDKIGRDEVSKIMLCLTPTIEIVQQALTQNCDMIVSHHPMFYVPCKAPLVKDFVPQINMYCAHTNMDKANGGTTDTIIKTLKLKDKKIDIEHEFLRFVEFDNGIDIAEFSKVLSEISPNARLVNNRHVEKLRRIAFCAGSGSEFINEAKDLGADCLVTGDLKFHTALDSEIMVYDIGHFESEILILPVFEKIIGNNVEIVYAKEQSPFEMIFCHLTHVV